MINRLQFYDPSFGPEKRPRHYKLDEEHNFHPCSLEEWITTYSDAFHRQVGEDRIGTCLVSTVFLGLDHNYTGQGPPILFETCVFGLGSHSEVVRRYCTWDEAAAGHKEVFDKVSNLIKNQ